MKPNKSIMESLFDVFNSQPIVQEAEVKEPPKKKVKREHVESLMKKADDIVEERVGPSYNVITDHGDIIPHYKPAFEVSYEPYDYQKTAGAIIDAAYGITPAVDSANILASSPTGSGKTFLIKHAAYRAAQEDCRLIIGVPLVALAEQTFAELRKLLKPFRKENDSEYSPVGIRTGPSEMFIDSKILVCTYEVIAIQMALDLTFLNDCPVVILDEIHFMTDRDRGARVESICSSLPYNTCLIGLSGTIPNAKEFAHSMSRATGKPTRLIGMKKRPIRLRYFCHLGGKLTEICHNTPGTVEQRFKKKAWDYVTRTIAKRPERLNYNQTKGRVLQLVQDIKREDKFPLMIVSFSCKMLNTLGKHLQSVDLVETASQKSYIHQQFQEVKKRVGDAEWGLFEPLMVLAKKGIGIHHSQNPKLYLEILPNLVKRGLMPIILATSSLSTGIDLPVRSICILSLIQPGKNGFRPIEPSLLQQIFGRSGRPGLETEGNAIIAMWQKPDKRVDVMKLLFAPSQNVQGNGMVQPREILMNKMHSGTPEDLLLSPFSSKDVSHVDPVIKECEEALDNMEYNKDNIKNFERIEKVRKLTSRAWRGIDAMVRKIRKGDTIVVEPEGDAFEPVKWTVISTRPTRVKEYNQKIPNSWILDCIPNRANKIAFDDMNDIKEARILLTKLSGKPTNEDIVAYKVHKSLKKMQFMISVERHPLYGLYKDITAKLTEIGFIENGVITSKGKMVPGILGCEDPICLVESWYKNILPRTSEIMFASSLSCFLQNHRHNQPMDETGTYAQLCSLQKYIGDENDLGTNMMEPIKMWMEGKNIFEICQKLEYASPGHVCKTIQRLIQLLEQIQEASQRIGDSALFNLCESTRNIAVRGLPFVTSMYLK